MNNILHHVAEETLENLAFLFSFGEKEDFLGQGSPLVALRVLFTGEFSGELVMRISQGVLPEMAANMLGLDEEDVSEADQLDAASETLNVICGNLLPAIAGKQAVFNITSPEILADGVSYAEENSPRLKASATLPLENGCCDLHLLSDGDVGVGAQMVASAE